MYAAEVWGCCRQLDDMEQIQLRACRVILGVGRMHPKTSLQMEQSLNMTSQRMLNGDAKVCTQESPAWV